MNYNFSLFPDTFTGWIYFLATLIVVAFVIFIRRRVKRGRKGQSKSSSNSKSAPASMPTSIPRSKKGEKKMQEELKKHMTPKNMMWMFGTMIYLTCIVLMFFAPTIAESAVISFALWLPILLTIVVFIYAPNDKLKTSLYSFAVIEAVVIVLAATGYGRSIINIFVRLAGIVQCLSGIVFVGAPIYGLFLFAKRKGWTQQAEVAADSTMKNFFDQFKTRDSPPE